MARVDGPPEPMISPVRSFDTSLGASPLSQDRLIHRDMVPGGSAAMKTHGAAVEEFFGLQARGALDLAAEAEFGVFLGARNAGLGLAQARQHFLRVVADRGDDPHAGDDDASHPFAPAMFLRRLAWRSLGLARLCGAEQADAHVLDLVDAPPVGLQPAVGDAENQLALEDALDVDAVDHTS